MEFNAYSLLVDFCIVSGLLFIAQILRGKIKFFQDTFVPSSVIAGFLGLFLGPQFLNILAFSKECSSYPYLLICVLFAGLFIGKKEKISIKKVINNVGDTFCVNMGAEFLGFATACLFGGIILSVLFKGTVFNEIALLQPAGFTGGHGYAAAIGGTLNNILGRNDCVYIGQTFATIGLLVGIFGGLILINFATRKGATRFITSVDRLPESVRTGIIPAEEQKILGLETIHSMTMDPLAFHITLILLATGLGYGAYHFYKSFSQFANIEVPMMCLTMLAGVLIQFIINKLGYGQCVDKRIIDRIGSSVTDYLVVFGIATIQISVVKNFWIPILIMSIIGIVWAVFMVFFIGKKLFHNFWFERSIFIFGYITGVVAIGVTLLRIVDPDMKSRTLDDFGTAYTLQSIIEVFLVMFAPILVVSIGNILTGILLSIIGISLLLFSRWKYGYYNGKMSDLRKGEKEIIG